MRYPARQAGKANRARLYEVVHRVIDDTEVEHLVTKVNANRLVDEIVEALEQAKAFIPGGREITINIEPKRPEVSRVFRRQTDPR
jgi:hypothetical protein